LTLSDPAWTDRGDGTATRSIPGTLAPGASVVIDIGFTIPTTALGKFSNLAEISTATPIDKNGKVIIDTTTGKPILDVDSTPDDKNTDPLVDDEINNRGGDEDDHDIASIELGRYDLSLVKKLAADQSTVVAVGEDVVYDFVVTNQGTLSVGGFTVEDRLPSALRLSKNDTNGWTASGGNRYSLTVTKILQPGESMTLHLVAKLATKSSSTIVNIAELTDEVDPSGKSVVDVDSHTANQEPGEDDQSSTSIERKSSVPGLLASTGAAIGGLSAVALLMFGAGFVLRRRRD
jgi:uncharacterized repeat protein (TIGR01451 family)